ncbi:MAG: AT hook motif protein [Oligoflexia bacterium]|nr:AT hook motif protein [Oligoflexia bacterium]
MKNSKIFPFSKARRISTKEILSHRKAIESHTGEKRKSRGRPPKTLEEKYKPISIRLHPKILIWAGREAKKKRIGAHTVINNALYSIASCKHKKAS